MNLSLRNILMIVIGVVGYCVWAFMAYVDPTQRAEFLKFNVLMCAGTIGLVLRDMQSPPPPPPPAVVTNPIVATAPVTQ